MKMSEYLQKALQLFGPNGENWIRGAFERNGCYCSAGALRAVRRNTNKEAQKNLIDFETYSCAFDALDGSLQDGLYFFNDHKAKSFADVKELFEKTIEKLQKEGR